MKVARLTKPCHRLVQMTRAASPSSEAFELVNPGGDHSIILICDHASNAVPEEYGTLGLARGEFARHIAYDIGAADVTRALSAALNAPAVLSRFSRLVIDANRGADDPTLVMKLSDGSIIPGNAKADAEEVARRIARFHQPYHDAIAALIDEAIAKGLSPALISVHSFTPAWKGRKRPWQYAVLWDKDGRIAQPLLQRLREEPGLTIGDNEPYSGELENDTMNLHGTRRGLPHVLIEIRQDLIETQPQANKVAAFLTDVLRDVLKSPKIAARQGGTSMDPKTRTEIEAQVFRRLVEHLRKRNDVQNIDLMGLAGFCRNCLGDWFREAAAKRGITLEKDAAREIVYGMPPAEWKAKYQRDATPEQKEKFKAAHKDH
jgi:predicted N-formylglutamate amidohydrolase